MNVVRNSPLAGYYARVFDIRDFGASVGLADNGPAIQAALNVAVQFGGKVYIPSGVWPIATPLLGGANVVLQGDGLASVLSVTSAFPSGQYVYTVNGLASPVHGVEVRDVHIAVNSVSGVSGLHIQGTYNLILSNVKIDYFSGYALWLDGTAGMYGAYSTIDACQFLNGVAASGGHILTGIRTDRHEHSLVHNCSFAWIGSSSVGAYGIDSTGSANRFINNWFDMVNTPIYVDYAAGNIVQFNDIDRINGGSYGVTVYGNYADVSHNHFQTGGQSTPYPTGIRFNTNVTGGVCSGNNFENGGNWVYAFSGGATAATDPVLVADNNFGGYTLGATQNVALRNNYISTMPSSMAPAVPATATLYTNPYPYAYDVYLTGGTVTAVAVNGVTTGFTSGYFFIPPLGTIELTYSAAPTWVWIAHA